MKQENAYFCKNVVQIKFNAWHYLDTSLWAPLVNNILEGMHNHVSPEVSYADKKKNFLDTIEEKRKEMRSPRQRKHPCNNK